VAVRAIIVDDEPAFIEAASRLLEGEGVDVVGAASTGAEAAEQVRRLEPDVVQIDVQLGEERGFDLARRLAATTDVPPTNMIMVSTHAADDLVDLVAVSPVLGFLSKSELSAAVISDFLEDRGHGHGCRHEALVYSSADELVAATTPFVRHALATDEAVLVVMRDAGQAHLREALDGEAPEIEFADATDWYRSTEHAFEAYHGYIHDHLERGGRRVRVVAEVIPSVTLPDWGRYEAEISVAMSSLPASFICAYDTRKLSAEVVGVAARTHHLLRTRDGVRPSAGYEPPGVFAQEREWR
jgi:CheY-like chemotaxis protein